MVNIALIVFGLVLPAPALAQGAYTQDQMRLAGQIGAVVGVARLHL